MNITLSRRVELIAYDVVMEIGRAEKRPDILAVLMRTRELGGRITAEDICRSFFPDRPVALGHAVISRCADLGVLERDGRLTPLGEESLEKGRVFQPERGRYSILCTRDPLIPQELLALQAVAEAKADQGIQERRDGSPKNGETGRDAPGRKDIEAPDWVIGLENRTITLLSGEEVHVQMVERRCVQVSVSSVKPLTLRWLLPADDDPTLRLQGFAERVLEPPAVPHHQVLAEFLRQAKLEWDPRVGALRSGFEGLEDAERSSFRRNLHIERPEFRSLGTFDPCEIRDIPLAPAWPKDAQQWARWLLIRSITTYMSTLRYEEALRSVRMRFPEFPVSLPGQAENAELLRSQGGADPARLRTFWYLQAPLDLEWPEVS